MFPLVAEDSELKRHLIRQLREHPEKRIDNPTDLDQRLELRTARVPPLRIAQQVFVPLDTSRREHGDDGRAAVGKVTDFVASLQGLSGLGGLSNGSDEQSAHLDKRHTDGLAGCRMSTFED